MAGGPLIYSSLHSAMQYRLVVLFIAFTRSHVCQKAAFFRVKGIYFVVRIYDK